MMTDAGRAFLYTVRTFAVAIVLFIVIMWGLCIGWIAGPICLRLGWIPHAEHVITSTEISTASLTSALIGVPIAIVCGHLVLRKIFKTWHFRSTLYISSLVAILGIAGLTSCTLVSQTNELMESPDPMFFTYGRASSVSCSLKYIGNAVLLHSECNGSKLPGDAEYKLPAGTSYDREGRAMHGWAVGLLPYLEHRDLYEKYQLDQPWNDPANDNVAKSHLSIFINNGLRDAPYKDADGYGLNHFATNCRVIGPGPAMDLDETTDGLSKTIMVGEINEGFLPWAHPRNYRDPAQGLRVKGSFGGFHPDRTIVALCDGSYKLINNDIDPAVLRALATPAADDGPDNTWEGNRWR